MNKNILLSLFILNVSCNKDQKKSEPDSSEYNYNVEQLNQRIDSKISKKLDIKSDGLSLIGKPSDYVTLELIAELSPPNIDGVTLQATDVTLQGDKLFVSYNVAGETKVGGIDALKFTGNNKISFLANALFTDRDINGIDFMGNSLYFTGSQESEKPAFLSELEFTGDKFSDDPIDLNLDGYAGTNLSVNSKSVYVTTGDNAGFYHISREDFSIVGYKEIDDARSVAIDGNNKDLWVLSGQPGLLSQASLEKDDNLTVLKDFEVGGATIAESKSDFYVGKNVIASALSDGGVKFVCKTDGKILHTIENPKNVVKNSLATANSLTVSQNILYVANGEAGVHVYKINAAIGKECSELSTTKLGYIEFGDKMSANFVFYKSNRLFVANGLGGLKIILVNLIISKDEFSID